TFTVTVYVPSALGRTSEALPAYGWVGPKTPLTASAIWYRPDVASVYDRVKLRFGFLVDPIPLMTVSPAFHEPVGATVSLTMFTTTTLGLPAGSVSVTVSVTGPSSSDDMLIVGCHLLLPLKHLLSASGVTPSVTV